jgi:tetratricopeptide (TPR) repeat protein
VRLDVPGAWLAAAVFAVHPVEVESVAWITERKNVLSLVFYLAAMHAYLFRSGLGFRVSGSGVDVRNPEPGTRNPQYFVALALFLAALFSKTVTLSFPAAVLLILWWRRGRLRWTDVVPLIPFFLAGIAMGLVTSLIEHRHVGATGEHIVELRFSILQRFMIAGRAIWFYAGKLLWPGNLVFIYPRWPSVERAEMWNLVYGVVLTIVIVALFLLRHRIGRGPLVAVLLFCGTLFPALGFVNVYPMRFSFVADHFQYHASIALIVLVVAALWRMVSSSSAQAGPAAVIPILLLAPLVVFTYRRARVFDSAESLWLDALARNKTSWMIYTNLANDYVARDLPDKAAPLYLKALELAPYLHDTHTNAGSVYGMRGEYDRAIDEFRQAIAINPNFAPAYYNWGQVYERQKKLDDARSMYEKALELKPFYPEANYRLGRILADRGKEDEAIEHYRTAVTYNPDYVDARIDLAVLLMKRRQFDEAMANLVEALRVQPRNFEAWTNLGSAQLQTGHLDDALDSFNRALQLNPGFPPAAKGAAAVQQLRALPPREPG